MAKNQHKLQQSGGGGSGAAAMAADDGVTGIPVLPSRGYARRQIDLDLTAAQAERLRDVAAALAAEGRALASGRPVRDGADAVAWILEQIKQ